MNRKHIVFMIVVTIVSIARVMSDDGQTNPEEIQLNDVDFQLNEDLLNPRIFSYASRILFGVNNPSTEEAVAKTSKETENFVHFEEFVEQKHYDGTWIAQDNSLWSFKQKTGRMRIFLNNEELHLTLIDGVYFDNKYLYITESLTSQSSSSRWKLTVSQNASVLELDNFEESEAQICELTITVESDHFTNETVMMKNTDEIVSSYSTLQVAITSTNCSLSVVGNVHLEQTSIELKFLPYSFLVTFVALLSIISTVKLMREIFEDHSKASNISVISLVWVMIWDCYYCLIHLQFGLSISDFVNYFITPSFWFFILFALFEMRLLVLVIKIRLESLFISDEQMRRKSLLFHCLFYIALILGLMLIYLQVTSNLFLILGHLYVVPHIIHVARKGQHFAFDFKKNGIFYASRILLPLYFRAYPLNFLEVSPSYSFSFVLLMSMIAQIGILYGQSYYGTDFFVPELFMKPKYNYFLKGPDDIECAKLLDHDECAICMHSLKQRPHDVQPANLSQRISQILKRNSGKVMRTPCGHLFHCECLINWMAIKLACPTCRQTLPAL